MKNNAQGMATYVQEKLAKQLQINPMMNRARMLDSILDDWNFETKDSQSEYIEQARHLSLGGRFLQHRQSRSLLSRIQYHGGSLECDSAVATGSAFQKYLAEKKKERISKRRSNRNSRLRRTKSEAIL